MAFLQNPDVGTYRLKREPPWQSAALGATEGTTVIIVPAESKMAVYADASAVSKTTTPDHEIWTTDYKPGVKAPKAGIYRCKECPIEIGVASGYSLPPTDHHTHRSGQPIR